jgi:osmoprotectant transport system substrate-binding protein
MMKKWMIGLAAAAAMAVGVGQANAQIVVGGKSFTEQLLLSEMTTIYLNDKGFDVQKRDGMGSTVLRRAQLNGQIDLYWEYVGTSLIVYNKVDGGAEMAPEKAYQTVKDIDSEQGLVWLNPSDANNTYALAMRESRAQELGIEQISQLPKHIEENELSIGTGAEFAGRPDGLPGLQEHYDFRWPRGQVRRMQDGLVYNALRDGNVDVGVVFATDGRIPAFNLQTLEDDKNFFPNYALTPVVREDTLEEHPNLRDLMNTLSDSLDSQTMRKLNQRVDVERETVEAVAEDFLKSEGLI